MVRFLFPGEGSQHLGMGHTSFDAVAEFDDVEREVAALFGYSVRERCLKGSRGAVERPAIHTAISLRRQRARVLRRRREAGPSDGRRGHSLGEHNALMAVVPSTVTAVRLVAKRSELVASAGGGAMAAVLRVAADEVPRLLIGGGFTGLTSTCRGKTVISGPTESIAHAEPLFERAG